MSKLKIIGIAFVLLVVLVQFIPANRPDVKTTNERDLLLNNTLEKSVASLIKTSCYDCHSNESVYPWYAHIAPVSWLVNRDIREGRRHLNFSEWEGYNKLDKAKMLNEITDEVNGSEMPMSIYVLMHPKAKLSESERKQIVKWADQFGNNLFSVNTGKKITLPVLGGSEENN